MFLTIIEVIFAICVFTLLMQFIFDILGEIF
jgi:hypothetical protein